jgi:hypothetical protein
MRLWIQLGAVAVGLALLLTVFYAWRADRRDRAQLQEELTATRKTIDDLTAQQNGRDAQLKQSLAQLAAQKQAVRTPAQALQRLPAVLPLPAPLREEDLQLPVQTPVTLEPSKAAVSQSSTPKHIIIPAQDLQPLYDFALDCKACQTRLAAAQADLADERAKTQALSRERDDALLIR